MLGRMGNGIIPFVSLPVELKRKPIEVSTQQRRGRVDEEFSTEISGGNISFVHFEGKKKRKPQAGWQALELNR